MSKALVIKDVSFSANKIETVTFAEVKPCTAVSVSPSTITFTNIGATQELTITKTPSDTTDTMTVVSSNENVCTVSDGVVSVVGIGTATITVTCGEQTATVSVTATSLLYSPAWSVGESSSMNTTGGTLVFLTNNANKYIFAAKGISSGPTKDVYQENHSIYALELPKGCDVIRVTMDSFIGSYLQMLWYDSSSKPYTSFPTCFENLARERGISIEAAGNTLSAPENADTFILCVNSTETREAYADMSSVASAANIKIYAEASA